MVTPFLARCRAPVSSTVSQGAPPHSDGGQTGAQHVGHFDGKGGTPTGQQAPHLALRDDHAHAVQEGGDALGRDLPLMMLQPDETHQLGTEMTLQAGRQRRHDQLARRRQPAFPAIADHPRLQAQILNDEVVIAFEAPARRRLDAECERLPHHRYPPADARGLPAPPLALRLRPAGRLLHARGLELRPPLVPLQPRDLFFECRVLRAQPRQLGQCRRQPTTQRVQRPIIHRGLTGLHHARLESHPESLGNREQIRIRHPFRPAYRPASLAA